MTQPTPEKILAIIDAHDRAQQKQSIKFPLIYLCLGLLMICAVVYTITSKFSVNGIALLIMLFSVFIITMLFLLYLTLTNGWILSRDRILSILDKTKNYPEIKRMVINRLLSGSKLTGKDEEYIFSELKKAEQSNEREKRLQAIKEYTS